MPDLIVRNPRGSPVVVETEYVPARTVEQDAIQRLGRELSESGVAIEQCVALRVPKALQQAPQVELDERTALATYKYCLFSRGSRASDHVRWPSRGWLTGGVDRLAGLLESASISERIVAKSLDILEQGISEAAVRLREAAVGRPDVNTRIAATLCQEDGEQTSRMAMAIVANALTFQTMLAGAYDIQTLDDLRRSGVLPKAPVMNPPFTRPTNHEATDVPVPSFAGLGNDADEQGAMSRLLKGIRKRVKEPAGHGKAGLASNSLIWRTRRFAPAACWRWLSPVAGGATPERTLRTFPSPLLLSGNVPRLESRPPGSHRRSVMLSGAAGVGSLLATTSAGF